MIAPRTWEQDLLERNLDVKQGAAYRCPQCQGAAHAFCIVEDPCDSEWRCSSCIAEAARVKPASPELTWDDIRGMRSVFLQSCDWTQMSDVAVAKRDAWALLRQEARDITKLARPDLALEVFQDLRLRSLLL